MDRYTDISSCTFPHDVDAAASHHLQSAKRSKEVCSATQQDTPIRYGEASIRQPAHAHAHTNDSLTRTLVLQQDQKRSSSMAIDEWAMRYCKDIIAVAQSLNGGWLVFPNAQGMFMQSRNEAAYSDRLPSMLFFPWSRLHSFVPQALLVYSKMRFSEDKVAMGPSSFNEACRSTAWTLGEVAVIMSFFAIVSS